MAQPVNVHNGIDFPGAAEKHADLFHLADRQEFVTVILQMSGRLSLGMLPYHAHETTNRARIAPMQLCSDGSSVDRLPRYAIKFRLNRSPTYRRKHGNFGSISERRIRIC